MNEIIQRIRAYPKEKSIKVDLLTSIVVVLVGAIIGFVAKATDSVSVIGDIGTELGVWIFFASIIAAYSRYPYTAAVNVMLFFLSSLAVYYLYGNFVLGFFPRAYFMGWLIIALLSPIAGFVVWFAKGAGVIGAIVTALPVSALFAIGYPAFYTHNIVSILTLAFGVCLIALLPKTLRQKGMAFCFSLILAIIINMFHVLSWLPF